MSNKLHRFLERLLLAAGLKFLLVFVLVFTYRAIGSRAALVRFDQAQATLTQKADEGADSRRSSPKQIRDDRGSLLMKRDPPLAILRLDRLGMRVPVLEGTNDLVLIRGAGWIAGTARPGAAGNGNVGIAGHRDGFFRGLKDLKLGDALELSTLGMVSVYAVDSVQIVNPDQVEVLRPRGIPSLTLVTCYPFYFIGNAPQRFIAHATLQRQVGVKESPDRRSSYARTVQFNTKETE